MFAEQPEIQGMNIVLLGDFNPKIFQPAWFASENLIRDIEAEKADIDIIHPEIVVFKMEWMTLQVTRERYQLGTMQEPFFEVIRDLCISTFRLLRHTPLRKLGINRDVHFRIKSREEWHAFGHSLAPKDLWLKMLKNPGLISLTIQGERDDGYGGYIRVKVEPSSKIDPGLYIQVNDHYEAIKESLGTDEIINILELSWDGSKSSSDNILHNVMNGKI